MIRNLMRDDEARPEEDEPDDPEEQESHDSEGSRWAGFVIPKGFHQPLMPDLTEGVRDLTSSMFAPLRDQVAQFLEASRPRFDFTPLISPALSAAVQTMSRQWSDDLFGSLRSSLGPVLEPEVLSTFQHNFLPPNLRDHVDEVSAQQVYDFLQEEGIPLYHVPRGATAVRLLRAKDRRVRRQVLSDRYVSLVEDCEAVLGGALHPAVRDEVAFTLDGIGAMRAGHTKSAQALFTVTLDSMIYRFYPDRTVRTMITNRKKDADVPGPIDSMGVHQAFVWLPVWNAHEPFWKGEGDAIPRHYSRHASVHGASKRQFSKRNCVQSLMLVTSLIGYADDLVSNASA